MVVAEKSARGAQGRRVRGGEHEMLRAVYQLTLSGRIRAPEDEHQPGALGVKALYHLVGKLFPAHALMGAGAVGAHREGGVEQKHALTGLRCRRSLP